MLTHFSSSIILVSKNFRNLLYCTRLYLKFDKIFHFHHRVLGIFLKGKRTKSKTIELKGQTKIMQCVSMSESIFTIFLIARFLTIQHSPVKVPVPSIKFDSSLSHKCFFIFLNQYNSIATSFIVGLTSPFTSLSTSLQASQIP